MLISAEKGLILPSQSEIREFQASRAWGPPFNYYSLPAKPEDWRIPVDNRSFPPGAQSPIQGNVNAVEWKLPSVGETKKSD